MKIKDIMTRNVITVHTLDNMLKVEEILQTNNLHHIPVLDDQAKITGIISSNDYAMLCNSFTKTGAKKFRDINEELFSSMLAQDVMTNDPVCILEDAELEEAVSIFMDNRFHALPVINTDGDLKGIITTLDLIKFAFVDQPRKGLQSG